jgi:hypothetical protein
MAALCSCKPEAEKDRLAYGGVHVSIEDAALIERILAHRRERGEEPMPTASLGARAPPQASLF